MQIINEEVSNDVSEAISTSTMPLSQAKQIYTDYKNKELALPYQIPEEHKTERIVLGSLQRWGQSLEVIPEGVGILGGEILMLDGKIFKDTPFGVLSDTKVKLGEKLINAANSSLEEKRKRQAQELLPMTKEESESALSKSISTVTDYGSQILLALATGGTAALAVMGARMAGETAIQGLEQYKTEHPEDKELKGFLTTGNLSKEVLLNAGKTAVNLYVEKAIGVPQQVAQFKKALKTPAVGAMGVLKAAGKGYAMGFGEEWATETIQGITDTTFDAFLGRYKDLPELANAYKESIIDAVYAGVFGGGFGASGHVLARGKAIGQVKQMMSNVVPEADLDMVATAIVDNHIASTKQLIGTQIQLSTELRDKHGEIFNAMNVAAKNAMMESGVAQTMTEDEIAQHSTELATMFADQVLAEATKRNVPIMDVIQGQDIVYDPETKELRLAPQTEESKARKAMVQYQDVAQRINEIDAEEQANGVPEYTAPTININGVERQTKNSDGKPIAKSEKSLRYFYNWFGDSKVVDEQGRPLVVYHATNAEFDTFDTSRGEYKGYIWTTSERDSFRANYSLYNMPLYIKIENPKVIKGFSYAYTRQDTREKLLNEGYDGVDNGLGDYVAFNPNQIKSVDNRGTWSGSENIYYQYGGVNAANVDQANLGKAISMIAEGKSNEEIRQATGWFMADDKKLRKEFSDKDSKIIKKEFDKITKLGDIRAKKQEILADIERFRKERDTKSDEYPEGYLDDLIEQRYNEIEKIDYAIQHGVYPDSKTTLGKLLKHDKLYEAYPFMKDMPVVIGDLGRANGSYDGEKITISERLTKQETWRDVLLHEIQHIIQEYEGFARGGSTKTRDAVYKKIHSEVSAKTMAELIGQENVEKYTDELEDINEKYKDNFDEYYKRYEDLNKKYGITSDEVREAFEKNMKIAEKENHLDLSSEMYYYNLMGEAEARDTQARANLTDKQRLDWQKKPEISKVSGKYIVTLQDGTVIKKSMSENVFSQDQEQRGRRPKGMFDANSKVIKLFERADASTLDHELAHFWLDNMWTFSNSGAASDSYIAQFDAVKSFLGVEPGQKYLTYAQHEKFASAYEKYIHRGIIPNSMMGNVFDNYERFIRNVYDSINDIRYSTKKGKRAFKLTPDIIKFFDSMLTGGVDVTALNAEMVSEERNEEAQKADDTTMKDAKEVVREMPEREVIVAEYVKPVESTGETKESRLFERLKGLAGSVESVGYNVANIEENREKARKMWAENPDRARAILNGTEVADDVLRQTLYTEQQKIALQVGDTVTYLNSLRKQTAEATRMGQELSALRGVVEDITDPSYWIRSAELEALKNLAKKQTKNLENAMGNSPLIELTSRLDQEIKSLQKAVASKATNEEKLATLKEGAERIAEKYKGLDQPDTVFNQIDWDNEEYANDYIENKVKEKLGISLSTEKAKAFIQTARELDALARTRDSLGLPSDAFFAKKDELERMRNSHTPTSRTKVLVSTIGRSNMLTAPATSVLNVVSNTQNYAIENIVRKVNNALAGHTNDNLVDQKLIDKYRARTWDVFWKTGYDVSMMSSLLDERLYKGESVTHSEGEGAVRAVGRFAEKYVFSRLISSPDIYFRSYLGFPNYVGNEATDIAYKEGLTGKKAKARAEQLFKDAIKIEPETEQGKMIREKARLDSLVLTFQQDTKMAQMLTGIRTKINEGLGDIGIGDILSPFIKTPANIISMGFDASVGPFASPVNLIGAINDIRHGNIKTARVLQAVRQTTTATLAYAVLGLLVSMCIDDDDYIPDYAQLTQSQRNAVRAMGGSFGAVRIGNEWVSTDFFGTLEMPLVVFLNTRRTGNVLKGLASGVGSKFLDAPVLKDILGSSDAIKDFATDKNDILSAVGENVANAAISRLTPNAMNTIARLIDNKDRKANNVLDKLVARIPVVRHTLEERLNVATGLPQELGRINTLLLGSRGKLQESAPLAIELGRLAGVGQGANISDPTRAGDLKLLPDADKKVAQNMFAIEYSRQAGKLVLTPTYARMSDEAKKEALNNVKKEVVDKIKKNYKVKLVALKKKK